MRIVFRHFSFLTEYLSSLLFYRWTRAYRFTNWNFTSDSCCNIDLYTASFSFEGKDNNKQFSNETVLFDRVSNSVTANGGNFSFS